MCQFDAVPHGQSGELSPSSSQSQDSHSVLVEDGGALPSIETVVKIIEATSLQVSLIQND